MLRRHLPVLALSLLIGVLVCRAGLQGATPVFWTVAGQAGFLEGTFENLSIDQHGRLMLGPTLESVYESTAPVLWSLVSGADGRLYMGTGTEGQVVTVTPDGSSAVVFDSDELQVQALTIGPDGSVYAGTSPNGRVYRIPPSGEASVFFDPTDTYIWDLQFDAGGNLFVAAGEQGVVYRVTPDGTATPFYRTQAAHAIALALDSSGNLLIGTESPGQLLRVGTDGEAFLLLNSEFEEIRSILVQADGMIFVAGVTGSPPPSQTVRAPTPGVTTRSPAAGATATVTTEVTAVTVASASGSLPPSTGSASPTGGSRGAVYQIAPDGDWDILWESRADSPYDLSVAENGTLLVGTGRSGKIFQLSGDPRVPILIAQAGAQQVTSFWRGVDGRHYLTTANPGKLYRLSARPADAGRYTSAIQDSRTLADWGVLRWKAQASSTGALRIFTRSGNTAPPDDTWSAWSGPYPDGDGARITSPKARYIQWAAEFSRQAGGSPVLTSVTTAYLPKNARPEVASITVHPPGVVFQKPFPTGDPDIAGLDGGRVDRPELEGAASGTSETLSLGRRVYQKGFQTFVWRGQDDDGDQLAYSVRYRREGETVWRVLASDLQDTILVWDTTSVPDGTYLVKVSASDQRSNAPSRVLVGELESAPFDVDNGPPSITIGRVLRTERPEVAFQVRDTQSPLQRVEFSVDSERWRAVYPADGIVDALIEDFTLTLDREQDLQGLVIRATDGSGNVSTQSPAP